MFISNSNLPALTAVNQNLGLTGSNLYIDITGLSGVLNTILPPNLTYKTGTNSITGLYQFLLNPEVTWTQISTGSQSGILDTQYYCAPFNGNLNITGFIGTPNNGSKVTFLLSGCNAINTFQFPNSFRLGNPNSISNILTPNSGNHLINFVYINSTWFYSDTFSQQPGSILVSGVNIDWSSGQFYRNVLTGNTVFTFSNSSDGETITAFITNTGTYTVTWPTVSWPSGTAPTQTTGNHVDAYTFINITGNVYGNFVQNF